MGATAVIVPILHAGPGLTGVWAQACRNFGLQWPDWPDPIDKGVRAAIDAPLRTEAQARVHAERELRSSAVGKWDPFVAVPLTVQFTERRYLTEVTVPVAELDRLLQREDRDAAAWLLGLWAPGPDGDGLGVVSLEPYPVTVPVIAVAHDVPNRASVCGWLLYGWVNT